MSKEKNTLDNSDIDLSEIQFQKLLRMSLVLGIIIVSGFITYYVLFPEEGYIGFGILNEEERAENYPTSAKVNQSIYFYLTVENELDYDFTFKIIVFQGDDSAKVTPEGSKGANKTFTTEKETLKPGEDWLSNRLSVQFRYNETDQILIVELWRYNRDKGREFWDILWLRLDIYN